MNMDKPTWTYNEFLAFLLIYGAEMNYKLSTEELDFIKAKTGIQDVAAIKAKVNGMSDAEAETHSAGLSRYGAAHPTDCRSAARLHLPGL